MVTIISIKLTTEELALLDWLVRSQRSGSRSQAVRQALRSAALVRGMQHAELDRVEDARRASVPRRSAKAVRGIRRHRGDGTPTGHYA